MTPSLQARPPIVNLARWHQPRRSSDVAVFPSEVRPISERLGALVGQSSAMQEIFATIRQLAPTCASALITGPSGSGKELVAREIHNCSQRRHGPFIAINAAAIPETLIESELFGHEKGAFTGATERHAGCFEQAHGGTLFLDEIGEMPRSAQPRLLRVLENLRVRRLGGRSEIPVDVRVLAATSQPVETHLREDIFYRLSVFHIELPPLSARIEDISLIVQSMLLAANTRNGTRITGIDPEVLKVLQDYPWPGNARELRNVIERSAIVAGAGMIGVRHLPKTLENPIRRSAVLSPAFLNKPMPDIFIPGRPLCEIEEAYIKLTLEHVENNRTHAAAMLGFSLRTLRNRIASYATRERSSKRAVACQ